MRKTKEKSIENHLRDECTIRGGFCIKLNPLWNIGVPDRLVACCADDGRTLFAFVELKRPKGGKLSVTQKWWRKRLTALGIPHYVLHTKALVDAFLQGEL